MCSKHSFHYFLKMSELCIDDNKGWRFLDIWWRKVYFLKNFHVILFMSSSHFIFLIYIAILLTLVFWLLILVFVASVSIFCSSK